MSLKTLIPLETNRLALQEQTLSSLVFPREFQSTYQVIACSKEGYYLQTPQGIYNSKVKSPLEAQNTITRLSKSWAQSSIIVVLGLELGYHTLEILKQCPQSQVWVFEPSLDTIVAACQVHDFAPYIKTHHLHINLTPSDGDISHLVADIPGTSAHLFVHRPTYEHNRSLIQSLKHQVESIFQMKSVNTHTIDYFQRLWIPHILGNLLSYLKNPGIEALLPLYRHNSIIIVAAGPSLEYNLSSLKILVKENKCVLIAVNTVVPRLLYEGIEPHIVVAVDPQNILYHNLSKLFGHSKAPILVAHPSISPAIVHQYSGPLVFIQTPLLQDILPSHAQTKAPLDMGGSVATAAYSLALKLEPKNITFLGLDLAYSGVSHIRGNFQDLNFLFHTSSRFQTWEKYLFKKGHPSGSLLYHEGFYGKPVLIDYKFTTYIHWLENRFSYYRELCPVRNCTEGGVALKHIVNLPLEDILSTFSRKSQKEEDLLLPVFKKEYVSGIQKKLQETLQFFEESIRFLHPLLGNPPSQNIQYKDFIEKLLNNEWIALKTQKPFADMEKALFPSHSLTQNTEKWTSQAYQILFKALRESQALLKKILPLFSEREIYEQLPDKQGEE